MQAFWKRAGCGSIPSERRTMLVVPSKGRGKSASSTKGTPWHSRRERGRPLWRDRFHQSRFFETVQKTAAAESRLLGSCGHEFDIFNHPAEEIQVWSARAGPRDAYFVPIASG